MGHAYRKLFKARNLFLGQLLGSVVGVKTQEKVYALTFDDGPDPLYTEQLLDVLKRHGAKGTFFVLGELAKRSPSLITRMAEEGHELGNHSWDHPSLPLSSTETVRHQVLRTKAVLRPRGQSLFRPPFGHQSPRTYLIARSLGYQVVGWSHAGEDWRGEGSHRLLGRIKNMVTPGGIILLHDGLYNAAERSYRDRSATVEAVDELLAQLSDFQFITVTELLKRGKPVKRFWHTKPDVRFLATLGSAEGM